ncbi:MAG: PAS domain-containing protein [Rhodospirillales bacterium]|jgi:two-component system nitrogen regulation sensor histidine kinase GlnL|nr:PAS domain-containing protein [Rhodospirillales bacterium]
MKISLARKRDLAKQPPLDAGAVLNALSLAIIVIDEQGAIRHLNAAAEQLFESSLGHLRGLPLTELIPEDSALFSLIHQARTNDCPVSEYGVNLDTLRTGPRTATIQVTPVAEEPGSIAITLHEHSIAMKIGRQMIHRNAARSVTAMSAILAHEVKNPLSGIRGAAQLLEQNAVEDDRVLTRLICDETDRICALVDRMEVFSDKRPLEREPVNIHGVLEHVRRLAENGFGRNVRFIEAYDPSLPRVLGNRDQLIQVFLNLVKNAAEACPDEGGEVVLSTAYQHGVRLAVPGSDSRVHLPLVVSVQDNGAGIPEDLGPHLFDPFVTTKPKGSGLGLAMVAKIIDDHGGIVEFDSQPKRTVFRVYLPMVSTESGADSR